MDKYVKVPVVDVHKDNLSEIWPGLLKSIAEASFIALDTELSGLGDRKKLVAKSIEDRYSNLVDIAKSRAILAFGISCFKEQSDNEFTESTQSTVESINYDNRPEDKMTCCTKYKVCTYNLSVLCDQEFVVEPASLQFLIQHGFDFNKQFSKGISYHKGADKESCDYTSFSVRNLFAHILLSNKPVVLHNGLLDLVFLYHNLYSTLPNKLEVFTSDVYGMFSAGVLDTKYIAEYKFREPASYLSYLFRKSQRYNANCKDSSQKHIKVEFIEEATHRHWIEYLPCHEQSKESDATGIQICDIYAAHGFCRKGAECHLSHDIDHILDKQDQKVTSKKKRRHRKRKKSDGDDCSAPPKKQDTSSSLMEQDVPTNGNAINTTDKNHRQLSTCINETTSEHHTQQSSINNKNVTTGGHRAGIDAFMTGYCLATDIIKGGCCSLKDSDWVNKITLSGKELPLTLACSHFSKPSLSHMQKMETLKEKLLCNNVY